MDNYKIKIPIFYINLERSKEREESMINELSENSENYLRINGVDGIKDIENLKEGKTNGIKYLCKNKLPQTKQKLGCILSHLKAIEYIEKENIKLAIICEDDICFEYKKFWKTTIEEIVENAPENWNVIKIVSGNKYHVHNMINLYKKSNVKYHKITNLKSNYGSCFYIIKDETIKIYKEKYYREGVWNITGEYIVGDMYLFDIPGVYNYTIPLISFKNFKTTIGNGKNPNGKNPNETKVNQIIKEFYLNN